MINSESVNCVLVGATAEVKCVACGDIHHVSLTRTQVEDILSNKKCIQDILPDVSPDDREQVVL